MIASSFDCAVFALDQFCCLDLSCLASWVSHPWVLIAQQLLIDCPRYQYMIVLTRSYPMHRVLFGTGTSAVSLSEKIYVMIWSSVALLTSSSDTQPIKSLRVRASD